MSADGMPHDIGAEMATIGGMIEFPPVIPDVLELVAAEDFYRPAHQLVFSLLVDMFLDGKPIGPIAVSSEVCTRGLLERIGGAGYLYDVVAAATSPTATSHFAQIVVRHARRRGLVEAGSAIQDLGRNSGDDVDAAVAKAQDIVFGLSSRRREDTARTVGDLLGPTIEALETPHEGPQGVMTGLARLDTVLGGMRPGQMWVVAARPNVGKSTLALGVAAHAAIRQRIPTAYWSLEMPSPDLMLRLLAAEAGVTLQRLRDRTLSDDEWDRIASRLGVLAQAPLTLDDAATVTLAQIRAAARRMRERDGLGLVVVDYLQLVTAEGKAENRQQAVSAISAGLRNLSRDLDIPVVAVAQLNRASEGRSDRRPVPSDLRESGQIEQDADGIVLLHRDEKQMQTGEIDLIVAKNRHGKRDVTITAVFQGHYSRIVDPSQAV